MTTLNLVVSTGADDGYESNDSSWLSGYSTNNYGKVINNNYDIGLRWTSVSIPKDATINSASLQIHRNSTDYTDSLLSTIYGIAEDNATAYSSSNRPSQRSKTSASKQANESDWGGIGDTWRSIDITSIIQEIINRSGWNLNNALAIVLISDMTLGNRRWVVGSYEGSSSYGAKLDIDYTYNPGWTGIINGVTNPAKICGVAVANILKVNGVASST